ncbi:hypothetical protein CTAYLR_002638 [Chrysophaeum taylorii]|uniref:Fe2OG dioxygenase domain-containing protein n=1 Tax=Chrysophaeum taylorii TaxID=2483200 RepID=A0AAD7UBK5_9STRA|nr:hypothetical protein CTAYLR_002638 [Chrysophaeum taylorii]
MFFFVAVLFLFKWGECVEWGQWIPDTPAWHARLNYRAEQVKRIQNSQERWDAVMNLATTGLLVRNYTAKGYEVIRTPEAVHQKLNETLVAAMEAGRIHREHKVDQISGPDAKMVHVGVAKSEVMSTLKPILEAWSGVNLVPSMAYGLRLYQPGNTLTMHTDRLETHVISCIVHVDRDVDEPWPIVIEGYDGTSVEVDLQPGETLLYESAKCIHGRPRPLLGRWYTSLFVHYRPAGWTTKTSDAKAIVEPFFWGFTAPPDPRWQTLRLRGGTEL